MSMLLSPEDIWQCLGDAFGCLSWWEQSTGIWHLAGRDQGANHPTKQI
jgi:hypothetical protein